MVFNGGRWMVDGAQQEALNFYVIGSHGFTYLRLSLLKILGPF
jgi:hypothetical protein